MRMRLVLLGLALLPATTFLPVAGHTQQCPPIPTVLGCAAIQASASADIQLIDGAVVGTISADADRYLNPNTRTCCYCGYYPGDWGLSSVFRTYPPSGSGYFGGTGGLGYYYCDNWLVCQSRPRTKTGFRIVPAPGVYEFQWQVGACVVYNKIITKPYDSWDAPTCQTCVGDSSMACVHPTPKRSLVISSRPDLTLPSPLGDRTIERTYRTGLVGDTRAGDGMFGKGWHANFEYRIGTMGGSWSTSYGVLLFDASGRKIYYQRNF